MRINVTGMQGNRLALRDAGVDFPDRAHNWTIEEVRDTIQFLCNQRTKRTRTVAIELLKEMLRRNGVSTHA